MGNLRFHGISLWAAMAVVCACPSMADAQLARISGLSDVSFGTINTVTVDKQVAQSVCAYSGSVLGLLGGNYSITASGSGPGGAFTLSNGSSLLPYEVQWSSSSGQTSGSNLVANSTLGGQSPLLNCFLGLTTDASLIVILRSSALSTATAGSYSGTLTLILAPN